MKTKTIVFFTLLLAVSSASFAQAKLVLTYDPSGNQIQRQLCIGECELVDTYGSKSTTENVAPIAERFDDAVVMHPNPTTGKLRLHWDTELRGVVEQLVLIDYQGRVLEKTSVKDFEESTLDLSRYPIGTYLVKFIFNDQSIHTKQIIKK